MSFGAFADLVSRGFKFAQLEMSTWCLTSASSHCLPYHLPCHPLLAEVVLAELLSTFNFEKTDARIVWNLTEVIFPTVGTDDSPGYPMKVTLAK